MDYIDQEVVQVREDRVGDHWEGKVVRKKAAENDSQKTGLQRTIPRVPLWKLYRDGDTLP